MRASRELRREVIDASHALHRNGWVANHDGNITARLAADRFLATPTATSKADVSEGNLIEVDASGKKVAGTARPFSELSLHLAVYARRPDAGAVVHAHPPHATALACSGAKLIERPFIAEAVVSLGDWIPTVPFAAPKDAVEALAPYVEDVDAVLLGNHGVLTWGSCVELAYLRMELVEHLARIAIAAQASGGVRPLPDSVIEPLLASRARAGLGLAADKAGKRGIVAATGQSKPKRVVACAPAPHADVEVIAPGGSRSASPSRAQITALIREELVRALKE